MTLSDFLFYVLMPPLAIFGFVSALIEGLRALGLAGG